MKSAELRGGEANVTAKTKIETTAGATGEGGEAGGGRRSGGGGY